MKTGKRFLFFIIFICISYIFLSIIPINRFNSVSNENFYYPLSYIRNPVNNPISQNNGGVNKSLILVHGHGSNSGAFDQWTDSNIYGNYYNNVVAINYYWDGISAKPTNYIGNNSTITLDTDIANISQSLFLYLNSSNFTNIDFLCHSMGGIVVRGLICNYYQNLTNRGINISDIITLGTPNQGSLVTAYCSNVHPFQNLLDFLIYARGYLITEDTIMSVSFIYLYHHIFNLDSQLIQIRKGNPFLDTLKVLGDETPYDENITWTSIAGCFSLDTLAYIQHLQADFTIFQYDDWERGKNILFLNWIFQIFLWMDFGSDGLVSPYDAKLEGAQNFVWEFESHDGLLKPSIERRNLIINILTDKI